MQAQPARAAQVVDQGTARPVRPPAWHVGDVQGYPLRGNDVEGKMRMNARRQGALAAATLALAVLSAVGLAATSPAVEEHAAPASALFAGPPLP